MIKLSAVVSAYNEEKNIEDCLKSLSFADEIIVVNNDSTDNTEKIAKRYTKKVYSRPNNPMLNVNKNYGFSKANGEWILNLDADERVTEELAEEIKLTIDSGSSVVGFWIPRKNIIFGKWIQNSIWWPDYHLRLFKKGKGKFAEKHVHEHIEVDGETEKLKGALIHYNYTTVSQYLQKLDKIYTNNEAEQFILSGKKITWVDAIRFPANDFIKTFFAQKGYRDGLHGLVLSLMQAFYAEVVFAKVWEHQGFKEEGGKDFPKEVSREFERVGLEAKFWILTAFLEETKNIIKKTRLRLQRKRILNKLKKLS